MENNNNIQKTEQATPKFSYSVCHNIDGLSGFFTLTNREHLCETLADAVALADRFNQVTGSDNYRATATMHHAVGGGYSSSVAYKVIGVSPDGQPHSNLSFCEHPVKWISEAEYDALPEWGEDGRFNLIKEAGAHYFKFDTERHKAQIKSLTDGNNNNN